jgi:AP-1 complex subunit gamma-1
MSRDLFPEVETILASANPYIRRKAALCAMRICRKVPDLQEHFLEKSKLLLQDRNHGVLLCGLTLVTSLCEADELEDGENGIADIFRPMVPSLVKILKGLSASGYAPEHDVTGITDPFLQCKILQLLRVLARGDAQTSEQINDILAQVRSQACIRRESSTLITKGCYQHRVLQERWQLYPVRVCTHNPRYRSRFRSTRVGREHPGQILV